LGVLGFGFGVLGGGWGALGFGVWGGKWRVGGCDRVRVRDRHLVEELRGFHERRRT